MERLAKYANNFILEQVPNEVIERAKLLLLDSIAAIAYGNQYKNISKITSSFTQENSSEGFNKVPVIGTNSFLDVQKASLINGLAMVSFELDEGNPKAKGHPAAHFLPALLSLAIANRISGKQFLEAFIVNYEISARLGATINLNQEIHPHGNWGVVGNGFGVGKLLNWQEEESINGSLLSSSFAFPTLWKSVLEGHEVRNVIIGLNNLHTTILPNLVKSGFSASINTLKELYTTVLGVGFNEFPNDLEETYYILSSYFKFYSYCRFCHAPIDATLSLVKDISLDEISEINVRTYNLAARLDGKEIANDFAGKFSIPYAIASEIYEYYRNTTLKDVDQKQFIEKMMQHIHVTEDEQYTQQLGSKRITAVEITLANGTKVETEVDRATGDPDEPELERKIIEKSKQFLQPIFSENNTEAIIETMLNIEHVSSMEMLRLTTRN